MYNHNYLRRHNNSLVVCMWLLASNTTEVNDLCYQLFCAKRGETDSSLLPPCRDCLFMHLLRANYQAAIWKCCLLARPTVPDPTKCGLIADDGKLAIHWMRSPPAPDAALELLACKCVRSCKLPMYTCMAHGLTCPDMCKLQSCSNQKQQEDEDDIVELGGTDDDIGEQVDVWLWCLIIMFERSYNVDIRACCRPAVTRNHRKMPASNSVI